MMVRWHGRLATACVALLAGAAMPVHAADKADEAAVVRSSADSTSGVGFTYQSGASTLRIKPYIETESGYDSNTDNLFDEDPSAFIKLEGGIITSLDRPNESYVLSLKGRFIDFLDFDADIAQRTDFRAAFDATIKLSDTETLTSGLYFLRDLISPARADIYHSFTEYAYRTSTYRIKVLGKNHLESNFDNDAQGTDTFDAFSVSRAKAFDYLRSDGQLSALIFTQGIVQPFAIYDFGNVNYYNQLSGASIDRDATENFGIAGVRFQPDKNFRIDVGYRLNDRNFSGVAVQHDTNSYLDINMFWQPVEAVKITGVVERFYDEATSAFGFVDDVKSYGMTVDWTMAPKWRMAGSAYYNREEAIGDAVVENKVITTLSVTYDVNDHLEVFTSALGKWVEEDFSGDSYDRYKIGLGARLKY
jgi:hypothetical protein